MQQSTNEQLEKVKKLIEDIRINIFITKDENGKLTGRPMSTTKVEDNGSLWFFTKEYTAKTDDISHNNEVFLTYASGAQASHLTIDGVAELSDDKVKMKELWNDAMKAWFPDGLEDPTLLLIKVTPKEAEYWDSSASKIVIAYNIIKAIVTGKTYDEGEHGKVDL